MKSTKLLFAFALGIFALSIILSSFASAAYVYTTNGFGGGNPLSNIRVINFVCNDNGCNTLGARLLDANSGAGNTNVISFNVPSATGFGYATYWFAPSYRAMEMEYNPGSDGASSANLNFIKYANCQAAVNTVSVVPPVINATQGLTITANVQSAINEAPLAPYAEPNDADLVRDYFSALTNVTLEIRNSLNALVYSSSSQAYILHDSAQNFVFNVPAGTLPLGNYAVSVVTNVFDSKCSSNIIRTSAAPGTLSVVSGLPGIQFSGVTASPASPATYAPGQTYQFNATVSGNNINSVWITFNGVNRTVTNNGNVYSFTISDLRAGNYTYQWFATNSSGSVFSSNVFNYVINKATPGLAVTITPSNSVQNGTQTTATASGCPAQLTCNFYRDGASIASPDVQTFPVGTYRYIYNTTGNENYTAFAAVNDLNVWISGGDTDEEDATEEPRIIVITDDQLTNGYSTYMNIDDRLKFNFCASPYYIKLTEVDTGADKAYFTLIPGDRRFTVKEGQSEEIDLNLDGTNDIVLRVDRIVNDQRVKIYIKRISNKCDALTAPAAKGSGLDVYGEQLTGKKASSLWANLWLWLLLGILLLLLLILLLLLLAAARRKDEKKKQQMKKQGPQVHQPVKTAVKK